jgi:hypothetical protein
MNILQRNLESGIPFPENIPRSVMPQVDEADYPELLKYAAQCGVGWTLRTFAPPTLLRPRQRIDGHKALAMHGKPEERKPIMNSMDLFILDGNHRWMDHVEYGDPIRSYEFALEFDKAIGFLLNFPKAYYYGDGKIHPIRT